MTDERPTNHILLSVWLLGVAYGHERPAAAKAKGIAETDVPREVKALWRGVINGTGAEAVAWFNGHGAPGIGQAKDAVDAALESVRATARDKRADELRAAITCGRGADDLLARCRQTIAELT